MRQYRFTQWLRASALIWALFAVFGIVSVAPTSCVRLESSGIGLSGYGGGSGSNIGSSGNIGSGSDGGGGGDSGTATTPDWLALALPYVTNLTSTEKVTVMGGEPSGCPNAPQTTNIFETPGVPSKGIRGFKFRDGPRGVCLAANLPTTATGYSTVFPVAMARGATFDVALEKQVGEAMGDEMIASGHTMLLAPVINILRHPAWGRAQETYGEDSYLLGTLGAAFTTGVQEYVAACAKHYAANNIENNRAGDTAVMDEQTLHEIYGRHFEMVIQDVPGGVACIMAAYNLVQTDQGTNHCTQNPQLLTDILRGTFGFKGFVLTDWWAIPGASSSCAPQIDPLKAHARDSVNAGLDMELPWNYQFQQLESVVMSGDVDSTKLTKATQYIIAQQLRFKILDPNQPAGLKSATTTQQSGSLDILNNGDHIALSRKVATESMVLLKNVNSTLPIDKSKVHTIAVVGANLPFALGPAADVSTGTVDFTTNMLVSGATKYFRSGDLGSSRVYSNPALSSGPFAGIAAAAGSGINVVNATAGDSSAAGMASVLAAAGNADLTIVVAGLGPDDEGEEYTLAGDRTTFLLDDKLVHQRNQAAIQDPLIGAVAALGKPMVVVLQAGSVVEMPWKDNPNIGAIVMAWYAGQDGGGALGDLLFGKKNFSGKLPLTWPNAVPGAPFGDEPGNGSQAGFANPSTRTTMDYYLGYRYYDHQLAIQAAGAKPPLFAFGYGLSYTTYSYANLNVPTSAGKGDTVNVTFDVQNTGTTSAQDGDEVSFLFASYPSTTKRRSVKELKGYVRTTVPHGVTQHVTIPLRISDLKYWDTMSSSWQIESGPVKIMVGGRSGPSGAAPSDALPLTGMLTINP